MQFKNVLLAFSLVLFAACNNAAETEKAMDVTKVETPGAHAHEEHHEATALSLNNGAKWQTDKNTRTHAAQLNALVDDFTKSTSAELNNYYAFADMVQDELNGLINDCKMKGPEHDALHVWLEPVLKETNNIKTATTIEGAKQATEKLTENVRKFNQYFI